MLIHFIFSMYEQVFFKTDKQLATLDKKSKPTHPEKPVTIATHPKNHTTINLHFVTLALFFKFSKLTD